jgi:hypothetical protein
MSDLMSDEAALSRISITARASAERFSWQRVAHDHLGFLTAVARTRSAT